MWIMHEASMRLRAVKIAPNVNKFRRRSCNYTMKFPKVFCNYPTVLSAFQTFLHNLNICNLLSHFSNDKHVGKLYR